MAKQRKKKRTQKGRTVVSTRNQPAVPAHLQIVKYQISYDPIEDKHFKRLPQQAKDLINKLYEEAQKNPEQAIPQILEAIEKYPNVPALYNYLSVAYQFSGEEEKAEQTILENYQRHPDYLFARLNYAEIFRKKGEYDKIAEIFDHKFDLKLLYPKRKTFHISEVVNFMGLIGIYFVETGKRETAGQYLKVLSEIAPKHPLSRLLGRKLNPL